VPSADKYGKQLLEAQWFEAAYGKYSCLNSSPQNK
jgi:hypothetical protein